MYLEECQSLNWHPGTDTILRGTRPTPLPLDVIYADITMQHPGTMQRVVGEDCSATDATSCRVVRMTLIPHKKQDAREGSEGENYLFLTRFAKERKTKNSIRLDVYLYI